MPDPELPDVDGDEDEADDGLPLLASDQSDTVSESMKGDRLKTDIVTDAFGHTLGEDEVDDAMDRK